MANEVRLIDCEAIARKLKNVYCTDCNVVRKVQCSACWVNDVLELLDGDSVDAVEVVRCKDCKHQVKTWISDARRKEKGYCIYDCKLCEDGELGHDDDFCSYGERRTE